MKRRKNNKIYIVLLLVLFISIGFAYLSATLNINGLANITGNSWKIYFDNIQYVRGQEYEITAPTTTGKTTTSVNYEVFLPSPGDTYKFNIDVVNEGTLDAMVKVVNDTELTSQQKVYASYYVTYNDGISADDYQLLPKNSRDTLSVIVSYNKDIKEEDMPTEDKSITVKFHLEYEQATSKAKARNHITVVNRQTEGQLSVGDEIALGDEHFYIIDTNEETTTLFTKYNLYVGSVYRQNGGTGKIKELTEEDEGYGRQNISAKGFSADGGNRYGVVAFSTQNYWVSNNALNNDYGTVINNDNSVYNSNYSEAPIYDETTKLTTNNLYSIAYFVNNYENYLNNNSMVIKNSRLLTYNELNEIKTINSTIVFNSTSYWLGTVSSTNINEVYSVTSINTLYTNNYSLQEARGVRPVIEIPALDI